MFEISGHWLPLTTVALKCKKHQHITQHEIIVFKFKKLNTSLKKSILEIRTKFQTPKQYYKKRNKVKMNCLENKSKEMLIGWWYIQYRFFLPETFKLKWCTDRDNPKYLSHDFWKLPLFSETFNFHSMSFFGNFILVSGVVFWLLNCKVVYMYVAWSMMLWSLIRFCVAWFDLDFKATPILQKHT